MTTDHKDVPESSPDPPLVHKIDIEQPTNYDHENGIFFFKNLEIIQLGDEKLKFLKKNSFSIFK